ncbi:MAG: hypothetical protein ACI4RA_09570 [Kiritimatiellia bacterium]
MLTEEQKAEVAAWFAAGASLDEIQKRMKHEFNVHMTYLDLRLMVAEFPQPAEVEPEPQRQDTPAEKQTPQDGPLPSEEGEKVEPPKRYDLDAPDADEGKPSADVVVEMDALTIPGTYASGDVTFSDGTKAKWYLDQQGRLGLGNAPEGFRPSPSDAALFQTRLMELLRARGLA